MLEAVGRLPMPLTQEPLVEQVMSELARARQDISSFKTATEALDEDKRKRLVSLDSRFDGIDRKAENVERRVDKIIGDQQSAFGRSESPPKGHDLSRTSSGNRMKTSAGLWMD